MKKYCLDKRDKLSMPASIQKLNLRFLIEHDQS